MQLLVGLVSGLIFGLGLSVSGMLNPVKVSAFLDISGAWDPSLAMVMGGGLAVNLFAIWLLKKRTEPYFADEFSLPQSVAIDRPLLIGAALFGIGWALGGALPWTSHRRSRLFVRRFTYVFHHHAGWLISRQVDCL